MDLDAEKSRIRRGAGARRREIAPAEAADAAERICRALFSAFDFDASLRVGLYAALPDEVPTRPLFDALVSAGVECLLPRVASDGHLDFARTTRWGDLRVGAFGVLAPNASAPTASFAAGDLVVVPGVAFDRRGARLGRGGGCYDRTFPPGGGPAVQLCGMAYEVQIEDSIPATSHDRGMDAIVTEHGFRWTRGEHR
ncbi:MAG: 5-formyltetrahydrofolate cyclo-ligase [Deltaproteobacteria bacterium]|nr:5-formyltetrahydrofolate cyclo-ligase [Deltaproteobacteria bacterium]MBW2399981.1 5-formyltetrahydrofolate cyclo-ligase [Deltaproteobacteria bacterium]MBW2666865.1 5-formyltetrahydrofolate cyclo-ligase [Deltaproteobacteria bacterium]